MDKLLLPILLDDIVDKKSNELLKNINRRDRKNQQTATRLVEDQLQLFDKAMKLQLDALTFAAKRVNQWSEADQVIIAMACRTFNHLQAAAKLLLSGYWAEYRHLERGAFEAMTREWVFFKHPERVKTWFKGGKKGKVSQGEVNEILSSIEGDEMRGVLKKHYSSLSWHCHPNREAIDLETWNGKERIGSKHILGGYIHREYFPIQFAGLLVLVLTATMLLGIIGLYEATDTWKQECDKLREDVHTVVTKYITLAK